MDDNQELTRSSRHQKGRDSQSDKQINQATDEELTATVDQTAPEIPETETTIEESATTEMEKTTQELVEEPAEDGTTVAETADLPEVVATAADEALPEDSSETAQSDEDQKTAPEVTTVEEETPELATAASQPEDFEEIHETRQSRQHQQTPKKKRSWGKNIFTLISILVVAAVAGGAYYFFDQEHQAAVRQEQYENGATNLLAEIQEERNQSGVVDTLTKKDDTNLKTVVYTPKNTDGHLPMKDPEASLNALVEKAKKTVKDDEKAVIVGKLDVDTVSDQLDIYQLVAQRYRWDGKKESFITEKAITGEASYIYHKTGKPVSIKELIPEEADLLGIQQVIQQKILDDAKDPAAIFDKVLDMPRISMENKIEYSPEKLTITLPKNDTGTKKITLAYKDIAAFINTSLVDAEALQDPDKVTLDPNKKYVALTFDDGPNYATTGKVLDILKEKKATATFFLLGQNIAGNEALVKRMVDEGMDVGSHSYDHPYLPNLSDEQIQEQVRKTDKAIFEACGKLATNFRAPYGAAGQQTARVIGKPLIHWSVDSQDWELKNVAATVARVKDTLYEGSIVLMHDIHQTTVEALPQIIDNMRQEGYEFVSVDTLLQQTQKPLYTYFGENDFRIIE